MGESQSAMDKKQLRIVFVNLVLVKPDHTMNKLYAVIITLLFVHAACTPKGQSGTKPKTFNCLTAKIDELSKQSCEKGASVKEYKFTGKKVFVIDQGNCGNDMTSEVLDSDCKNLGYLGGISGNTKINGSDFSSAEFVKTIWEK